MKWIKRLFCSHIRWQYYNGWHTARRFGAHIYECKSCGKVKAFEPWNPPVNMNES